MKLTDLLISAVIKKGVLYEARNADVEFDIPMPDSMSSDGAEEETVNIAMIRFKAEHMTVRIEKE